jgi:hypothetical protein
VIADGLEILQTPESASQVLVLEASHSEPQTAQTTQKRSAPPAAPSGRRPLQ